ncbi:MAG: hypothetical protein M3O31_02585 [Acidobacteriota bacterium]|nr:hypothetical protein [Acidobacteriota bacterium]
MMKSRLIFAVLTVCLMFSLLHLLERPAYGYVDPGSGILACQAMSAFVAGAIFYFRQRVRRLFGTHHE